MNRLVSSKLAIGGLVPMPADTPANVVSYSADFTAYETIEAGSVGTLVVAPWAYTVGQFQKGVLSGSTFTTSAPTYYDPPFLKSFVQSVSNASSYAVPYRCAGLCVKITNVTAVANLAGTFVARRFGCPVRSTITGSFPLAVDPQFADTRASVNSNAVPTAGSALAQQKCILSLVNGIEGTTFQELHQSAIVSDTIAHSEWAKNYINTSNSPGDAYPYCPWQPTVIICDNTSSASHTSLAITFEFIFQAVAQQGGFLSTLVSKVPVGLADGYLRASKSKSDTVWQQSGSSLDRNIAPYVGMTQGTMKAAPKSSGQRRKPSNKSQSVPKQQQGRDRRWAEPKPQRSIKDELRRRVVELVPKIGRMGLRNLPAIAEMIMPTRRVWRARNAIKN